MHKTSLISNQHGFTLLEFLIATILFTLLVSLVLAGCSPQVIKDAYSDEVRVNLKTIQTALERYAADHNGNYPAYILGGDSAGWNAETGCETIAGRPPWASNIKETNLEGGGARPPDDPLISGGYIDSYPENPFMKDLGNQALTFSGGVADQPGSGDVRFGYKGTVMGNTLDDPRFLWGRYPVFDQPDKIRVQPTRMINTMSQAAYLRKFSSLNPKNIINPFYSTGGVPNPQKPGKSLSNWWPGQFFYRASGEVALRKDLKPEDFELADKLTIWDYEVVEFKHYILGAYADRTNTGLDLIRLTTKSGAVIQNRSGVIDETYLRSPVAPYPENKAVYFSPPEIFGGGDKQNLPAFPYFNEAGDFIYGAPDGIPDGILAPVLIDGNRTL